MSNSNIYMGWTFEDVLKASRKLNVKISCEDAVTIIKKVSNNHNRYTGCNWNTIYDAVRAHLKENKS